jgi:hypothetical protein
MGYPQNRLAGAGFGRIRPEVERSQNKEKPAGYQRVSGHSQHSTEVCGSRRKRQKVTRRDRQPLVFMRALCPQNRLLPTALPQRRSEGQKQIKIEPVGGCGRGEAEAGRPGSYPTRFTLGLRDRALHAPSARSVAASVRTHQRPRSRHEAGYRKCQFTGCLRYACLAAGRQAHGFCPGRGARPTAGPTRLRFGHNGYPGGWLLCLR